MAFTKEQLEERRSGIGGSEIAAVVGLSKWKSAQKVWEEKMGLVEPPEMDYNMERGIYLEDGIIRWTAHRTGKIMFPNRDAQGNQATMFSDRHQLCFATPDGMVYDKEPPAATAIAVVEVKSPGVGTSGDWADPLVMPDGVPLYYLPQVMWEMEAAQLREQPAVVAALIGGDIRTYSVAFNDEMVKLLWGRAEEFWGYVEREEPPPHNFTEQSAEWIKKFYKQKKDDMVQLTGAQELEMLKLVTNYRNAEQVLKEAEARKKEMAARMQDFIRDKAGMQGSGWKVTWKQDKKGRIGYKKAVEALGPGEEFLEQFRGEPARRFLVSMKGEE